MGTGRAGHRAGPSFHPFLGRFSFLPLPGDLWTWTWPGPPPPFWPSGPVASGPPVLFPGDLWLLALWLDLTTGGWYIWTGIWDRLANHWRAGAFPGHHRAPGGPGPIWGHSRQALAAGIGSGPPPPGLGLGRGRDWARSGFRNRIYFAIAGIIIVNGNSFIQRRLSLAPGSGRPGPGIARHSPYN